jgi:hypothetical protein
LTGGALAALLLGCSKHAAQQPAESQNPPSGPPTFNAQMIGAVDQKTIRAYLQNVREVKAKKFDVQWSEDTVPVSKEEALRSLTAISRDGNSYTFTASEPVVQKLLPGRIVWVWDFTVARIDRVGTMDGLTTIHTVPIPLSAALVRSDIEFEAPVDFGTAISRVAPKPTTPDSGWKNVTAFQSQPPDPFPRAAPASLYTHAALLVPPAASLFQHAVYMYDTNPTDDNPDNKADPAPSDGGDSLEKTEDEDVVAGTGDGFNGEIAGFEYSVQYRNGGGKLSFELEARKMEEGEAAGASNEILRDQRYEFYKDVAEQRHAEHEAEQAHDRQLTLTTDLSKLLAERGPGVGVLPVNASARDTAAWEFLKNKDEQEIKEAQQKYQEEEEKAEAAKQKVERLSKLGGLARNVFFIVSDNLDVRFRARADLDAMSVAATIMNSQGGNAGTTVAFKNLKGKLDLEVVARLGEAGTGGVNLPIAHIPVVFNVPVPVGGLPFIVQVAGDFLMKVGLSGRHAAHHFHTQFTFNGSGGGFNASAESQTNTNFNLSETEPEGEEPTANSLGVSGLVYAVQIPRLGLGMGVFGLAAMGFVDHVVVLTLTNGASLGQVPCKRITLDRVAHVGADVTTILPIPVVETLLHSLAWKKEVWKAPQWKKVEPDIPMCRI